MPRDPEHVWLHNLLCAPLSPPIPAFTDGKMAKPDEPLYKQAVRFAVDVASGRHALSKLIPVALWLADAVFCGLIIWKVACKLKLHKRTGALWYGLPI